MRFLDAVSILRNAVLGMSILGCTFIILTIILKVEKGGIFYQYYYCIKASISAICITHDSEKSSKIACLAQAFFIHAFWIVSFLLSLLISITIYKTLNGNIGWEEKYSNNKTIDRYLGKWIVASYIFGICYELWPMVNYGPTGWLDVDQDEYGNNKIAYIYCGYKVGQDFKSRTVYLMGFCLPQLTIIGVNIFFGYKIRLTFIRIRYILSDQQLNTLVRETVRVIYFPIISIVFWTSIIIVRISDLFDHYQPDNEDFIYYIYTICNVAFDLQSLVNAVVFYFVFRKIFNFRKIWTLHYVLARKENLLQAKPLYIGASSITNNSDI